MLGGRVSKQRLFPESGPQGRRRCHNVVTSRCEPGGSTGDAKIRSLLVRLHSGLLRDNAIRPMSDWGSMVRVVEGGSTANLSPKAGDEAPAKLAAMQQHHRQLVGCGGSCWSQRKKLVANSIRRHTTSSQKRPLGLLNNNDTLFIFAARRQSGPV
jgi:hypothetical protein